METDKAILAFSQSEKIKSSLIWLSQALALLGGLPQGERKGGERVIGALLGMVGNEIGLARTVTGNEAWNEIGSHIERAVNMVDSGVGQEATIHLTRALSRVTNIGLESMTILKERALL
jgi:hypothetical protein